MNMAPCPVCGDPMAVHLAKIEPGVKHPSVCSKDGCDCVLPAWTEAPGIMTPIGVLFQWGAFVPSKSDPGLWVGIGGGTRHRESTSWILKRAKPVFPLTQQQVDYLRSLDDE